MPKNMAYEVLPSELRTCMTCRSPDEIVVGRRNKYFPAGKVAPGTATGPLNVKNTRLSGVACAEAMPGINVATRAAAPINPTNSFRMTPSFHSSRVHVGFGKGGT